MKNKTKEEILNTFNNVEWVEGDPVFSYDQCIAAMEEYASQQPVKTVGDDEWISKKTIQSLFALNGKLKGNRMCFEVDNQNDFIKMLLKAIDNYKSSCSRQADKQPEVVSEDDE